MRLHQLTADDIDSWRDARLHHGLVEYGGAHANRYLAVDIMEEILDAENIACLLVGRVMRHASDEETIHRFRVLFECLAMARSAVLDLDKILDARYAVDTLGGSRVWWRSEERRRDEAKSACQEKS